MHSHRIPKIPVLLLALAGLTCILIGTARAAEECRWPVEAKVLQDQKRSKIRVWEFSASDWKIPEEALSLPVPPPRKPQVFHPMFPPGLIPQHAEAVPPTETADPAHASEPLPTTPALEKFRDWVRGKTSTEPYALIENDRRERLIYNAKEDVRAHDAILARGAGLLRPLSCLETLLAAELAGDQKNLKRPANYHAFVLRSGTAGATRWKVYFAAALSSHPSNQRSLVEAVDVDVRDGVWAVTTHLHSHAFFFGIEPTAQPAPPSRLARWVNLLRKNPPFIPMGTGGAPVPSRSDLDYAARLHEWFKIERSVITNGFNALVLTANDLRWIAKNPRH